MNLVFIPMYIIIHQSRTICRTHRIILNIFKFYILYCNFFLLNLFSWDFTQSANSSCHLKFYIAFPSLNVPQRMFLFSYWTFKGFYFCFVLRYWGLNSGRHDCCLLGRQQLSHASSLLVFFHYYKQYYLWTPFVHASLCTWTSFS
jgi:hypothetical protein